MAIAVVNTDTNSVVRTFPTKGEANAFVKATVAAENALARLDYWNRTEFPIGETLSR